MNNIHITSVGASIITNFKRANSNIEIPSLDEDSKFENFWTDKSKYSEILSFTEKDPYRVSAELNALKSFIENNEVDEVHLIVTDTFVGLITSETIKAILGKKNIKCSVKKIPGYYKESPKNEIDAEEKFIKGLSDLRDSLIHFIKEKNQTAEENNVLINATGGFKPEILILMLVGSLTNSRVYYIHEFFKRILYLPPVFLPFVNDSVSEALKKLNSISQKRISGEVDCAEYKSKFNLIYSDLLNFKLITEKHGEKDDKLFEIKITEYGKLLAELKKS